MDRCNDHERSQIALLLEAIDAAANPDVDLPGVIFWLRTLPPDERYARILGTQLCMTLKFGRAQLVVLDLREIPTVEIAK